MLSLWFLSFYIVWYCTAYFLNPNLAPVQQASFGSLLAALNNLQLLLHSSQFAKNTCHDFHISLHFLPWVVWAYLGILFTGNLWLKLTLQLAAFIYRWISNHSVCCADCTKKNQKVLQYDPCNWKIISLK